MDETANGNLYLIHQDGTYAKLTDIKDFDIGSSEPPDWENAPLFKYQSGPPTDYLTDFTPMSFTAPIAINFSMKKLYMELVGLTKRQQRLVIRRMERMRREELKTCVRYKNKLVQACMEIQNKGNSAFFNFLNN